MPVNPAEYPDDEPDLAACPKCGSDDTDWEQCWNCHGEGGFDMHDDDPINYGPGEETEACLECGGHGGYLICHQCIRNAKEKP